MELIEYDFLELSKDTLKPVLEDRARLDWRVVSVAPNGTTWPNGLDGEPMEMFFVTLVKRF